MKANEFRIGNRVYNKHNEVHEIGYNCFQKFRTPSMSGNPSGFNPILLTEEWFLRFGIKQLGMNKFEHIDSGIILECAYDCKYVHQIQNLYFAIIGEEIKEKL